MCRARYAPTAMPSRSGRKRLRRPSGWMRRDRHFHEPPAGGSRARISISVSSTKRPERGVDRSQQCGRIHAEPRLRVGDEGRREPVDEEARDAKRGESAGRHAARAAAAETSPDDERIGRLGRRLEQARNVVGIVLAVRVERDDAVHAAREPLAEAAPERLPLAVTAIEPDDIGARGARHRGAAVGGAVVDDEHAPVPPRLGSRSRSSVGASSKAGMTIR